MQDLFMVPCPWCGGKGKKRADPGSEKPFLNEPCPACHGAGTVMEEEVPPKFDPSKT